MTAQASGALAPRKKGERPPRAEADPLSAQRRATAAALLTSLADKARTFRDGILRARTQARAADALWELDPELSRSLFRRAWADADAIDKEIGRKQEEDRHAQLAAHGVSMQSSPPALRAEVLRLAGMRERALGRATRQSVTFLSALREKDAPTADKLFDSLLARASADPDADANTVSLLSSYVFTPFTFFTAYKTAGIGMNSGRPGIPVRGSVSRSRCDRPTPVDVRPGRRR
jgi:hypothetical protein